MILVMKFGAKARADTTVGTVAANSQYYTRLMTKLNDQETQIEKTQANLDDLQKKLDSQRQELEAYVESLDVG